MGELKNKVEGHLKSGVGRATGNENLEARGEGQKVVGKVEEGGRKARGAVEEGIGKLTGNTGRQAEGKARRA